MARVWGWAVLAAGLGWAAAAAELPAGPNVTVTDQGGAEVKVTGVTFTQGARTVAWGGKGSALLAVEFRETNSTTYKVGVVTLVPVSAVESVKYEEKPQGKGVLKTVVLKVAGVADPLTGLGSYTEINQFGVSGKSNDKPVAYVGNSAKAAMKGFAVDGAKPFDRKPAAGPKWSVAIDQRGAPPQTATNLRAVYAVGGVEELSDALVTHKGESLPLDKVKKLEVMAVNPQSRLAAVEVTYTDDKTAVVLIPVTADKKTFVGLVGEVPAGWKLFPLSAVVSAEKKE